MLPSVPSPKPLQRQYYDIAAAFYEVHDDWKKYHDEIIPEDPALAKRIIKFIIGLLDHIESHYATLDVQKWTEFLHDYYYRFYYGPLGDDHNYIDFDEVPLGEMLSFEIDAEKPMNKSELKSLKKKLAVALNKFS